jgi:hypothetical protein
VSAAAAMKAEDPAALVPFSRMSEPHKAGALEALAAEVSRAGGAPGLVARLAGQLRRASDSALLIELEIPRLTGFPSSKFIGSGFYETWALDLISRPLPGGLDVYEAFWLAAEPKVMPLAEAVALVADPERSPIAELDRRRAEVERRHKASAEEGAANRAERERAEAAEASWMAKNAGRVRRWGELPDMLTGTIVDSSTRTTLGQRAFAVLLGCPAPIVVEVVS